MLLHNNKTIHETFEEQVKKTPHNIAVVYKGNTLTYRVLNEKANQLSHYLKRQYKLQPETFIALCLDRNEYIFVSILAVLKTGCAYVPIDPLYPDERILYILRDTNAPVIITNTKYRQRLKDIINHKSEILLIDYKELQSSISLESNSNLKIKNNNLAYVIYTSGTTGHPKGVLQQHNNVIRLFKNTNTWFKFNNKDVWTLFHSYSFDFSVWEILGALIYGGKIIILSYEETRDLNLFYNVCKQEKITVLNQTPSVFYQFMDILVDKLTPTLTCLRYIILGGEALNIQQLKSWFNCYGHNKPKLINMYGITETTVHVTYKHITSKDLDTCDSSIGKPIADLTAYVLNENLIPVSKGIIGELYIGGAGLARGYLNKPALTKERFITNPFQNETEKTKNQNTRIYKTGDLVKWLDDGNLAYIGRNDSQIKIRGYRIELQEIESALSSFDGIRQSVVIAKEDTANNNKYLVGYYVSSTKVDEEHLRRYLLSKLPEYMIPTICMQLAKLPVTDNGKLDTKNLPAPKFLNNYDYVAPYNSLQKELRKIWAEILSLNSEQIGINHSFFRLGGNSIIAIKLVNMLNKILNKNISVFAIFKYNTIFTLASYLESNNQVDVSSTYTYYVDTSIIEQRKLSFAQERLWFIDKYESGSAIYNIPLVFKLAKDVNLNALEQSLRSIISRHEILRTLIKEDHNGDAYQEVINDQCKPIVISKERLKNTLHLDQEISLNINQLFNLSNDYPIKIRFYQVDQDLYLSIVIHHIVFDGWSIGVFLRELKIYYDYYNLNIEIQLPELRFQYKDFALWQKSYLNDEKLHNQLIYWCNKLRGYEKLNLITDKKRPKHFDYKGASEKFELTEVMSVALRKLAKKLDVSLYSVLIAAYFLMLRIYSNQNDVIVGTPVANRHYNQVEHLIGFFINTLVLRVEIDSSVPIKKFIQDIGCKVLEAQANQDLPFERLVSALKVVYDSGSHPIFQVMFDVQGFNDDLFNDSNYWLKVYNEYAHLYNVAKFDITTIIYDNSKKLSGVFNYATSLYDKTTITSFIETYIIILQQIAALAHDNQRLNHQQILDLKYLTNDNYKQIIYQWNHVSKRDFEYKTIHKVFEEQVKKSPDNIALVYKETKLTYTQLNERANQLANHLISTYNIKPDDLIALCLDRSEHTLITILAVLKAGGAYVPIDPNHPDEKIKLILNDTNAKLFLTNERYEERINALTQNKYINQSEDVSKVTIIPIKRQKIAIAIDASIIQQQLSEQSIADPVTETTTANLAYIIHTSGTTGQPKGVMIEHRGVTNLISLLSEELYFKNKTIIKNCLCYANYVFDAHVWEICSSILNGHIAYIAPNDVRHDLLLLSKYIQDNNINIATLPPVLLDNNTILTLEMLIVAGDKPNELILDNYKNNNIKIINAYGPTETTICSSLNHYDNNGSTNIGKPLANTSSYVLDSNLTPLPVGAIGELHIGGVGLARGYLNKSDLTAEKFIKNPFQTKDEKDDLSYGKEGRNARIYKTGDLVRWLHDGNLEYIGRNDSQIKIRGHRIELEEIENVLRKHIPSKKSIITVKPEGEELKIIAYLVYKKSVRNIEIYAEITRLRHLLRKELPYYMMPSYFSFIPRIPLNVNGKIDNSALSSYQLYSASDYDDIMVATDEYEQILLGIWQEVLGKNKISINANFFDLGGHSILASKVYAKIPQQLKYCLKLIDLFEYPTISKLSSFLKHGQSNITDNHSVIGRANGSDIAIIGMAGRFPGADNIEEYWENLKLAKECITYYSYDELLEAGVDKELLYNNHYVRAQSKLNNIQSFDAELFGYSPAEACIIDPQQRLFLECSWHALEDSGYNPKQYKGVIAIYAGIGHNNYIDENLKSHTVSSRLGDKLQIFLGNNADFLSTRVAYKLNLTGPAVTIQSACSTSLVAIHQACISLQAKDCNIALAGGVSLSSLKKEGYLYQPEMILSPDGKCRAFDAKAEGTISGQGVAIVVLKLLEDAVKDGDHIYAIIKSSAINNDGCDKVGFTAPSTNKQTEVIKSAHTKAGILADTITYVEAHGTGTILGDPIEIEALTRAFRCTTDKKQFCAIGSVKTNIGHLDVASGIAGLVKASLCLYHKTLVPILYYENPNHRINWQETPFYVNTKLKPWDTTLPRRAGVSSFGMGGTNAHIILEEAPKYNNNYHTSRSYYLINLSANTIDGLNLKAKDLANYLRQNPNINLNYVCYTLHVGRQQLKYNRVLVTNQLENLIYELTIPDLSSYIEQMQGARPIVFIFPGNETQYTNMGSKLYTTEPSFKENVDKSLAILNKYVNNPMTVNDIWRPTELALFIIEYSLAHYLISIGIKPDAMIAYGVGKYVAACIGGILSLDDGLALITKRASFLVNSRLSQIKQCLSSPTELAADSIFLEIGCGNTLTNIVQRDKSKQHALFIQTMHEQEEDIMLLTALGKLWSLGVDSINWDKFYGKDRRRIPLPLYPFERKPYWIDFNSSVNHQGSFLPKLQNSTDVQHKIALIWSDYLGINDVDINHNFFTLGGDSLLGIQIIAKIKNIFNVELKLNDIFEYPTIADLTVLIKNKLCIRYDNQNSIKKGTSSILIKLKEGSYYQPLFLIHPIGGYVSCYNELVETMTIDMPVYGIQCPFFDHIDHISDLHTIELIASYYIQIMTSIQPEGPYWLLGLSLGGVISFEIVQQLSKKGKEIGMVAILDAINPNHEYIKSKDDIGLLVDIINLFNNHYLSSTNSLLNSEAASRQYTKKHFCIVLSDYSSIYNGFDCSSQGLADLVSLDQFRQLSTSKQMHALITSMRLEALEFKQQQQVFQQIKLYCNALINYYPQPYNGKVHFFDAQHNLTWFNTSLSDTWKEIVKKELITHSIPGNHFSIIEKPNVNKLTTLLKFCINYEIEKLRL